jgi:hypothetical protein
VSPHGAPSSERAQPPNVRRSELAQRRRWAALVVIATWIALFATARAELFTVHTAQNHFALQAEAWLDGRADLGGPPPAYTRNNDFAVYGGRTWISFPPFPSVILLPFVWAAGSAEALPDGAVFLVLAALTPLFLFLALERMRDLGRHAHASPTTAALSLTAALGTVFWFSAVQGTVWFAAHVVGTGLASLFVFACVGARHPLVAGLALGLALATRVPVVLAAPLFFFELGWAARRDATGGVDPLDWVKRAAWFAAPFAAVALAVALYNNARFRDPLEFGHRHLDVVWRARMDQHGLFDRRYLGRNLGVVTSSLPFFGSDGWPKISPHGLALWLTSPFLLWLARRRAVRPGARLARRATLLVAALVAMPNLLYHNTGWVQFGYRFSNDFIVFLVVALALSLRRLPPSFWVAAAISTLVNAFGAVTFQRAGFERFYAKSGFATVFEPDP